MPKNKIKRGFFEEFLSHKVVYFILASVLIISFFVRAYRVNDLLQFYFDQGRDALVIWKFWHEGKFFLIGPVTGLAGIFLGPFYYYLIAPFYLMGGGNPTYPAILLAFITTLALFFLYLLGKSMHSRSAGLFAAIIAGFSYFIVTGSRWLSNPTPIYLSSVLLLFSMWKIASGANRKWWIAIAFLIGISLHFESASAVFYIPMIIVFAFFNFNNLPDKKNLILSGLTFFSTLIPQILFNFRHENLLFNNFSKLFFQEKAFRGITMFIFEEKIKYFWRTFTTKLYTSNNEYSLFFVTLSASALWVNRNLVKNKMLSTLLIFVLTPIPFYLFFQGNFGNLYDYYLSGYFLPFILFISIGLAEVSKTKIGKILVIAFLYTFLVSNGELIKNYLTATPMTRPIAIEDQLKAIDWVFGDAKTKEFNVDVYVPPVIPYAYDYLFLWQGTKRCEIDLCGLTYEVQMKDLYIVYEDDPPHPERLSRWMSKYKENTVVEKSDRFGGVNVEKRIRI